MQIQRLDLVALQIQRNVHVRRIAVPRFQGCVSIPHKISGSAGEQNEPNIRVIAFKRIGDTVANKEHILAARFAALLAFALVGVSFMGAGVKGNSDRVCLCGIALIGQLAVDLAAVLPVLALRCGQVGWGQGDSIAAAACACKFLSVHIPLIGDITIRTAFQLGPYPDIRLKLPFAFLICDLRLRSYGNGVFGRGGDGDRCGGGRLVRRVSCFAVCGQLQLIAALPDGAVGGNGDGLVVSGFCRRQTGGFALQFHFQGVHLDLAAGNGEGRPLTAQAFLQGSLLCADGQFCAGCHLGDIDGLDFLFSCRIVRCADRHIVCVCILFVRIQNGQAGVDASGCSLTTPYRTIFSGGVKGSSVHGQGCSLNTVTGI